MHKPVIYQEANGKRQKILGEYVVKDKNVAFQIAAYDQNRTLVIDPVLAYSTYLGGNDLDVGSGIAVDRQGFAYVVGTTTSTDFPSEHAVQGRDVFIVKLNRAGNDLLYTTILGGSDRDVSSDIAVDNDGSAYVAGSTLSADFPTTPNSYQTAYAGGRDGFVFKLNRTGNQLIYSTYLGGTGDETLFGEDQIAVNNQGEAYITGDTSSADFPTKEPLQDSLAGDPNNPEFFIDAFVTKLSSNGKHLIFSTYLGGSDIDDASGIAVDRLGAAYVVGSTNSRDFPTKRAFKASMAADDFLDAFVTKLKSSGKKIVYSTYLGGNSRDQGFSIAVNKEGAAFVTGSSDSIDFPTKKPIQQCGTLSGDGFPTEDAFVTGLDEEGNGLIFSTCLGGTDFEQSRSIALDTKGAVYITGSTNSSDFPIKDSLQMPEPGSAFVTKLKGGKKIVYSTFFGTSNTGAGIAVDQQGAAYVTGNITTFGSLLLTSDPLQALFGGGFFDAFVTKIKIERN